MSTNDNLRLFTKALESGEYPQGIGALRTPVFKFEEDGLTPVMGEDGKFAVSHYTYCCLGVACEVYMQTHDDVTHGPDGNGYLSDASGAPRWINGVLPPQVEKWLGVDDDNPSITVAGHPQWAERPITATYANDKMRWDFSKIAAAFRSHYGVTS